MEAIVSVTRDWAIGRRGRLLVANREDMRRFVRLTRGCACVMGRKTYESFPKGPLKGRRNVVVTRRADYVPPRSEGVGEVPDADGTSLLLAGSPAEALELAGTDEKVWLIGGESLYQALLPQCSACRVTMNDVGVADADAFFPNLDESLGWRLAEREGSGVTPDGVAFEFLRYERA